MVKTPFESQVSASARINGFVRKKVDLGSPALNFSTFLRKGSQILPRNSVDAIKASGFLTIASIYVPENRTKFSIEIDIFLFNGAVEAQPCADEALLWRDYSLTKKSNQHGLLIGGGTGLKSRSLGQATSRAQSHAVVRGRFVIVVIMESSNDNSVGMREEVEIFISNLHFDDDLAPGFIASDIARTAILITAKPFELAYPAFWTIADQNTIAMRSGSFIFVNGEPLKPSSIMSFGFRHGDDILDEALLYAWASRISKEYGRQNKSIIGEPKLVSEGTFSVLKGTDIVSAFYIFSVVVSQDPQPYQIRVAVIGSGDKRYTFSLFTDTMQTSNLAHFTNYAYGVTAFEMAVDSFLFWLVGRGLVED